MPWLSVSFRNDLCKALLMPVVINQVSCSMDFVPIKYPIDSSILNLFFSVLLKTLCSKLKRLLLSMHCIAYAFGKFGYTNVHSHENSVLLPYLSWLVTMLSHNQKVPRRNLGHRVCCSHPTATRSALGIFVVRKQLATKIFSLCLWLLSQSLTHHTSNRVILTCIMSTIPHKHVHRINFEKLSHLKNNELTKPQICEVS
jgi:hypothetical protein